MVRPRRKGDKPIKAHSEKLGGTSKKAKQKFKSPEKRAEELRLQRMVFDLTIRGMNARQIAAACNVGRRRAARLVARALDEAMADRDELVHLYMAKSIAQGDALLRTWMPRAMGYQRVDENGNPLRNEDGTLQVVEPDPKAALIVARVIRDRNILIGYGTTVKVEHTGAQGGPIMTAHLDARASAAMIRESFPNGPRVILAEGQDVTDVPKLADKH
jgi:hypothetical protein